MYKIIIITLVLFVFILTIKKMIEPFDETGTEFLPVGYVRYGLRGEKINNHAIDDCYYDQYKCYTNGFYPYTKDYINKVTALTQV